MSIVTLNVGGTKYTTSLRTLVNHPDSMLGRMFSADSLPSNTDEKGRIFIDANGEMFKYILDFLRRNELLLPDDFKQFDLLFAEARYFQIKPLIEMLSERVSSSGVTVNVGGIVYTTSMQSLVRFPNSLLGRMFTQDNRHNLQRDGDNRIFIDANGRMFRHILDFLRRGDVYLSDEFCEYDLLLEESKFFEIKPLTERIHHRKRIWYRKKTFSNRNN